MAPCPGCAHGVARSLLLWLAVCTLTAIAQARRGYGAGGQEYGYVDVRPDAHLFYWLYYAQGGDAPAGPWAARPLVVWLEGGPGASSTSYGSFGKLGPLGPDALPRNFTWVSSVNLLFVDSPVGTGYSYVDKASALASSNRQTAEDLVEMTRRFLERHPQFRTTPWYVFGESYGGKVAAEFALCLYEEIAAGRLSVDFKGVVMGDSWLAGVGHVESWAPYLYQAGMVDSRGRDQLAESAARVRAATEAAQWQYATTLWSAAWQLMTALTEGVNIYDVLAPIKTDGGGGGKPVVPCGSFELMNGDVKRALAIPDAVTHHNDNSPVFSAQYAEFMQPATSIVEQLLTRTNVSVTVYAGQRDVFTNIPGTMEWLDRLRWPLADRFREAPRVRLSVDGEVAGSVKQAGTLAAIRVYRAGHMVAIDYPAAAAEILRFVTKCPDPPAPCI